MENVMIGVGAVIALVIIFRFATKKVSSKGHPQQRGRGVVVVAPSGAAPSTRQRRATFGTVIIVNVICLVGFIVALLIGLKVEPAAVRGLGGILMVCGVTPWIAMKFVDSQDPGNRYSLFGALAALCIMAWIFGTLWYIGDAMEYVRGLNNG